MMIDDDDVSFEAMTVILVWSSHLLITPFVLSRNTRIALVALALLAGVGATLMATRDVNLMIYTHYVPGTSALIVGRSVLRGDGGPIVTANPVGPAIIFTIEGFISQYLALKVYGSRFFSLSHNLLHFVAASWMASYLADHLCARCCPSRLPALRLFRLLHDPAVMVCLGVLMIGHQHDTTPIGELFHDTWGTAFIAMGVLHFVSSAVHATHAPHARLSLLARALHSYAASRAAEPPRAVPPPRARRSQRSYCAATPLFLQRARAAACASRPPTRRHPPARRYSWLFNGLWACLMGLWMNLWGDKPEAPFRKGSRWTGTREILFPAIGQELPSGFEEGCALLAFTLWAAGLMTALDVATDNDLVALVAGGEHKQHMKHPTPPTRSLTHPDTESELLVGADPGGSYEAAP